MLSALLAAPVPVPAAVLPSTIHIEGTDLVFRAADGVTDDVEVSTVGSRWYITDLHPILTGPGCEPVTPDGLRITCDLARFSRFVVRLGDGDDEFTPVDDFAGKPYFVYAGAGDDTIRLGLVGSEAEGEDGNDTIIGSPGADSIRGGGGDDSVRSLGGGDKVGGGPGANWIDAGSGDDDVSGGDGVDLIAAGFGNDRVWPFAGNDIVSGGDGNDRIEVYRYDGLPGDDYLSGDLGSDKIFGGRGNERILGGPGIDELHGGPGDDSLDGNEGADKLYGEDGEDSCSRDAADTVRETCELG
ncbi:calcium-binding protein [Actinoplanes sp. NPDC049118]|uniref:calcium-binding protein n=1 Tax=Actinoplanes sp. NPDC049118 TaxID=3155769 RepID=UPI0033F2347C